LKKNKNNVKLCKFYLFINVNTKKFTKIKIILCSLECSIPLGENFNSHVPFPIFAYPFQNDLAKLCISVNLLKQFWFTHHKSLQKNSSIVEYWQALKNAWPKQMLWKLSSKPNISQLIIDFTVVVIMFN
jgi:hypothetical protein